MFAESIKQRKVMRNDNQINVPQDREAGSVGDQMVKSRTI